MARLNDPPMSADTNFEILRRKFLRQNRDIAKINSDQSQKIRRLENDCACLLSENLQLRGQIIRLEKQIEDNSARRIADHALEIKAKLEEQLAEFGALLGNLGMEPPSKRHSSSEGRRISKPRRSGVRSPPARKRRDTSIDAETLAAQEGRLPPIFENKSYPRATMNSEEILALCAAAADTSSDSLELGPPPVSRFIEEIPVKHDSPARKLPDDDHMTITRPPRLDFERKTPISPEPVKKSETIVMKDIEVEPEKETIHAVQPSPTPTSQTVRAGAKRKYGDENNVAKAAMALEKTIESATSAENSIPGRAVQKRRSIKELPTSRKRQPLAVKSTNEDVSSPKKADTKSTAKSTEPNDLPMKDAAPPARPPKTLSKIDLPPPAAPPITVMPEPDMLLSPTTPFARSSEEPRERTPRDTPPPAHISSEGETSRPSRRVRAAVSYAEPNLRDKMRRPTKELFDAVSGLQRPQRPSLSATSAPPAAPLSAPTSVTKPSAAPTQPSKESTPTSPSHSASDLASSSNNVVFDRRRQSRPVSSSSSSFSAAAAVNKPAHSAPAPPPIVKPEPEIDVYDFTSTNTTPKPVTVTSRPSRKSSMAAQAALHKIMDDENDEADTELTIKPKTGVKNGGVRKQRSASLAPKRTSMMEYLIDGNNNNAGVGDVSIASSTGSSGLGDESSSSVEEQVQQGIGRGGSKVSRRRSMMV